MRKILVIGPVPEPTTGVSLANKVVIDYLNKNSKYKIDFINTSYNKFEEKLGKFSFSKLFFYLKLNFYSYKIFKINTVYITPGQTFFGVLKYAVFFLLAKVLKKEVVVHIHGNHLGEEYRVLKGIKKSIFKKILGLTTKGIVLSESLKWNFTPFIKEENIYVLYNFVEDYLFVEELVINDKLLISKPRIVYLSNLMEEKGIFNLLEALKVLEIQGIEYQAKIAGNIDIKNKHKAERYFNQLKNCEYCGIVTGDEKKTLLLWGNIFVLPTYYKMEGQPISILEAMATANLVLTTKHAGIPDIFKENINGFYVEKQDEKSIELAIRKVILEEEKCNEIRKQNYFLAKKEYKVSNFILRIIIIFEA